MSADGEPELWDEPERDGQYEYNDPDEFHRVRRLEQIHDARERFETVRLKALEAADRGRLPRGHLRLYASQMALDYVRQLEPILRRADADLMDRNVTLSNPEIPEIEEETVTVGELLDRGGRMTKTYKFKEWDATEGRDTTKTDSARLTMDRAASTRLVRLCDDFLEEVMPSGLIEDDTTGRLGQQEHWSR